MNQREMKDRLKKLEKAQDRRRDIDSMLRLKEEHTNSFVALVAYKSPGCSPWMRTSGRPWEGCLLRIRLISS